LNRETFHSTPSDTDVHTVDFDTPYEDFLEYADEPINIWAAWGVDLCTRASRSGLTMKMDPRLGDIMYAKF
jgi:hypothetical protein